MKLLVKVNLVLFLVSAAGLATTGFFSYRQFQGYAERVVLQNARIMMETALGIRDYTVKQVRPLLAEKLKTVFLPQTVPAYAATENFRFLNDKFPEYRYKEATLNPTNPRNRATDWESDIVEAFRSSSRRKEIVGHRNTPTGRSLYLARPIRIKNKACLGCHSTPEQAPASVVARYGSNNGFGWKHQEVVGAQIVSVPMSIPVRMARNAFAALMGALSLVFLAGLITLNVVLRRMVVRPVKRLAAAADEISRGNIDVEEMTAKGGDEVAELTRSFTRMHRSLRAAMRMLDT